MKSQSSPPEMAPLLIEILALEEKYKEALRAGAEFDVLKPIRAEIRRLKDQLPESSNFTFGLNSNQPTT